MLTNMNFCHFVLSDNFLGNEGIKKIADVLAKSDHIIRLDVSCNDLTNEGAAYLFETLAVNTSLIDLNISSKDGKYRNKIQARGISPLKQVLINNPYLQILNLSGNMIHNEGVQLICQGILESPNKALLSLDLSETKIDDEACEYLHNVL